MDHLPRFLEHSFPQPREWTVQRVTPFREDPFWDYQLLGGTLVVSSADRFLDREDLEVFPDHPGWMFELIEGTLLVTPNAPNVDHHDCGFRLAMLLHQACPPGLKTFHAPFELSPAAGVSVQPDVMVARLPVDRKLLTEPPLLAAEVLSPSSRWRDTVRKRALYQELGIEHYWIVDPAGPSILRLELVDGTYCERDSAGPGDQFRVSDPVSLSFDPAILID